MHKLQCCSVLFSTVQCCSVLFLVLRLNFVLINFSLGVYLFLTPNIQGDVENLKKMEGN